MGDLGRRRLPWTRLKHLVAHLPRDSAYARARFGDAADWGPAEYLAAATVDHLAVANWQRAADKHAARPQPVPRPGAATGTDATTTRDMILRRLAERKKELTDGR